MRRGQGWATTGLQAHHEVLMSRRLNRLSHLGGSPANLSAATNTSAAAICTLLIWSDEIEQFGASSTRWRARRRRR
jgi:hypothetical protein